MTGPPVRRRCRNTGGAVDGFPYDQHCRHRTEHQPYAYRGRNDCERYAEVFGFTTPQAIYKWIHGTAMPTIDNMVILARMFDVTVDDIIAVDTIDVKCG